MCMLPLYRIATAAAQPLMPWYLRKRLKRGKEDPARLQERFGYASLPRPEGKLLWLHSASVGEAQSVLPLITRVMDQHPKWNLLVTTGTRTSAQLMLERLPRGVIHQFVPVDTPQAVTRFLEHWRPDAALWVESELWPNLVSQAHKQGVRMALINARMSARSCARWRKFPQSIRALLASFRMVFAQTEQDAAHFKMLGAPNVSFLGNLKYDSPALPVDKNALADIKAQLGNRPFWLAASIHPGEELAVAHVHCQLKQIFPDILSIAVPRHPQKAAMMEQSLHAQGLKTATRSRSETFAAAECYLADTMGELGTFYALGGITFIGGSLVQHGGQNPLEAARFANAIAFGPYMNNFADIQKSLIAENAAAQVTDAEALARIIAKWLNNPQDRSAVANRSLKWLNEQAAVGARLLDALAPLLAE